MLKFNGCLQVQNKWMKDFKKHYEQCFDPTVKQALYVSGVEEAVKVSEINLISL